MLHPFSIMRAEPLRWSKNSRNRERIEDMRQPRTALKPQSRVICEKFVDKAEGEALERCAKTLHFKRLKLTILEKDINLELCFVMPAAKFSAHPSKRLGEALREFEFEVLV